jgi:hypothetical protein
MRRGNLKALAAGRVEPGRTLRPGSEPDERRPNAPRVPHVIVLSDGTAREVNGGDAFIVLPLAAMRVLVESVVRVAFDDALAARVAEIIGAQVGAVAKTEVYSTSKLGPHVPGKTRDWMIRHVKHMKGAVKIGRDWQISRADFVAWQGARDAVHVRGVVKRGIIAPDDEALADEALRNAGYRANGRKSG